jgi:probable HAF family extracellular repeat protein
MRVRRLRGLQVGLVLVVIVAASACTVRLGTLGGFGSAAYAINDGGTIVGSSAAADNQWHPFVRLPGEAMLDLGLPASVLPPTMPPGVAPPNSGSANAVNNHNLVVGTMSLAANHTMLYEVGFQWTEAGGVVGLPGMARAADVNDAGTVVGVRDERAAFLDPGDPTTAFLPTVPSFQERSAAAAINGNGDIAGCETDGTGVSRPVWWSGPTHVPHALATDLPSDMCLSDINDAGQAVGTWFHDGIRVAAVWDLTTGNRFDIANNADAVSINDDGIVVGQRLAPNLRYKAFRWSLAAGMVDLAPSASATATTSGYAFGINASGQACGYEQEAGHLYAVSY